MFFVDKMSPKSQHSGLAEGQRLDHVIVALEAKPKRKASRKRRVSGQGRPTPSATPATAMAAKTKKNGLGCGWILTMLVVAGITIFACGVAPTISPLGWFVIIGLYILARHLERVEERLADIHYELEKENRRPPDEY